MVSITVSIVEVPAPTTSWHSGAPRAMRTWAAFIRGQRTTVDSPFALWANADGTTSWSWGRF